MGRNDNLTSDVLEVIESVHSGDKRLNAKQVAYKVRARLGKAKSKEYTWPADSTVRKWVRVIDDTRSREDEPWSIGALRKDDWSMPVAAFQMVVELVSGGWDISIREAKWIGRLHSLQWKMNDEVMDGSEKLTRLVSWARLYALEERSSEIMGADSFDSRLLDSVLFLGAKRLSPEEAVSEYRRVYPFPMDDDSREEALARILEMDRKRQKREREQ